MEKISALLLALPLLITTFPLTSPAASAATFSNPVIYADVPDSDVIRVGNAFYMTSTTMHMNPGVPVMKSYDLVNWSIVNYVYDTLGNGDIQNLNNGQNEYGRGSWRVTCGTTTVYIMWPLAHFPRARRIFTKPAILKQGHGHLTH